MGMACTRVVERALASVGELQEAPSRFEPAADVVNGGVLWAVPALLANGLLRHNDKYFQLRKGFYGPDHIFLLLAFMALDRIKSVERLRYEPAGEMGKLLGLDRIPEVRTLRKKLEALAQREAVGQWSAELSREWMEGDPEAAGVLYVDGHVRVYHGSQTKLPRRYVSRERLCLRGTTDYWVNDQTGRPFFVVSTPLTAGLIEALRTEIIPRLLRDVPGQPTDEQLQANPLLARFAVIFDREGYSPDFFREMWSAHRIACQTYHKYAKADWAPEEFAEAAVAMPHHQSVTMTLAERGTRMSNGLWVREIRKQSESGHQVSVISTDYQTETTSVAGHMFSRWSQENFFSYMIQHFGIDRLIEYETEPIDETTSVVNPARRALESQIKSKSATLVRRQAAFGQMHLTEQLTEKEIARYEREKGLLREEMDALQNDVIQLKTRRKETPRHIALGALPEAQRFAQLAPVRKQFMDTIRMIAYRAETALTLLAREVLARPDDARPLLREIFTTAADLIPNHQDQTLTVSLHHLTNALSDQAARHLAVHLNQSETLYPGTNLRLIFKLVSDENPPDQEF
jgi:prepilin-type processing-associated H-X9-DG protein